MTPIERVSARNRACEKLGLSASGVTQGDIRQAYRKLARRLHPDVNQGETNAFVEMTQAFEFLNTNADDLGIPAMRPTRASISRPTIQAMENDLSAEEVMLCADALGDLQSESGKHVPAAMRRRGRRLTYIVRSKLTEGLNKIAVPARSELNAKKVEPRVLEIEGAATVNGAYVVPAELCAKLFPGANRVSLEFQYAA